MRRSIATGLALAACFALNGQVQGPAAAACVKDLESIPSFLLENDAGARVHLAQLGQKYFDDALAEAKKEAAQIDNDHSCAFAISKYLQAWRRGHLGIEDLSGAPAVKGAELSAEVVAALHAMTDPAIEILSAKTLRLTLKTFAPFSREPLIALLKVHHDDLVGHENWIVDVRGNGGGTDRSYQPLMPWLMPDELANAGVEILVTPANLEGWTRACALYAPGDKECEDNLREPIERMRKAKPGTYVAAEASGRMSYAHVEGLEAHRPSRVAILIDAGCVSSCEQFLLEARQSFNVKLIGQHTLGALDYSNLRPHDLPSGMRRLRYATTRSTRIPGLMVDVAGIPPDIYLPIEPASDSKQEEVHRVQSWLEGGSLVPRGK
jgi:hypothetical protein